MIIKFDIDNAAFTEFDNPVPEVTRILKKLIQQLENGKDQGNIIDINGNKVGEWCLDD